MRKLLRVSAQIATIALAILVFVLSMIPNPEDVPGANDFSAWIAAWLLGDPDQGDKISHFIAYAAISAAGIMGFARSLLPVIAVLAAVVLFGAAVEVLQGMTDERQRDAYDLGANALGALAGTAAGIVGVTLFRHWKPKT